MSALPAFPGGREVKGKSELTWTSNIWCEWKLMPGSFWILLSPCVGPIGPEDTGNAALRKSETLIWQSLAHVLQGKEVDFSDVDDKTVADYAERHGVTPLLDRQASKGAVHGLGEDVLGQIRTAAKTHASMDLLLNHATRQLLARLADNNIPALLLKGTPLSLTHYPEPYLRARCDTDLYIRESDIEGTARLLPNLEYAVSGPIPDISTEDNFIRAMLL